MNTITNTKNKMKRIIFIYNKYVTFSSRLNLVGTRITHRYKHSFLENDARAIAAGVVHTAHTYTMRCPEIQMQELFSFGLWEPTCPSIHRVWLANSPLPETSSDGIFFGTSQSPIHPIRPTQPSLKKNFHLTNSYFRY